MHNRPGVDVHDSGEAVGRRTGDRRASMRVIQRRGLRISFLALAFALSSSMLSGCFLQRPSTREVQLFDLQEGQVYGPVIAPPIFIRLGQSVVHATGSVGPADGPEGSPAIWEGHALALEP